MVDYSLEKKDLHELDLLEYDGLFLDDYDLIPDNFDKSENNRVYCRHCGNIILDTKIDPDFCSDCLKIDPTQN